MLRCDVQGRLVMKAFLSGMPDIKLGLNEKLEVGRCVLCHAVLHAGRRVPMGIHVYAGGRGILEIAGSRCRGLPSGGDTVGCQPGPSWLHTFRHLTPRFIGRT